MSDRLKRFAGAIGRFAAGNDPEYLREAERVERPKQTKLLGAAFDLGFVLSLVVAGGVAALMLVVWGIHTENPCPCSGDFCIFGNSASSGADAHLPATAKFLGYGGIVALLVFGFLVWRFRTRLRHPLLTLLVGFPVFWAGVLASTWLVARTTWGPTRC